MIAYLLRESPLLFFNKNIRQPRILCGVGRARFGQSFSTKDQIWNQNWRCHDWTYRRLCDGICHAVIYWPFFIYSMLKITSQFTFDPEIICWDCRRRQSTSQSTEWGVSWRKRSLLTQVFFTCHASTNQFSGFSVCGSLTTMGYDESLRMLS